MQKQKFDEIVSYFNKKVSEMEIETKYKMELLGMVTALGYAHEKETHGERTETHECDCISRRKAIDAVMDEFKRIPTSAIRAKTRIEALSPAQPEIVRCKDCRHGVDYYHEGDCYCSNPKWGLTYFGGSWEFYCADAERRTDEGD